MSNNPTIFVVSGPGGVGKTTLVSRLFRRKRIKDGFVRSISYTTRQKRPKEVEGKDYCFVSKEKFLKLKKNAQLLESERVLDDYYGTPLLVYRRAKREKKDLVLCIDVKGGMCLKKTFKLGKIITVFIAAPTPHDLYKRMKKRVEKQTVITRRVQLAKKELQFAKRYDYVVVNQEIDRTLTMLEAILMTAKDTNA